MNSTYIWEITSKQDGLLFPEIEKEGESLLEEKWGESLLDQWKSFKLKFLDDYGTQQADFYFILGFIPVASESICSLFDFKESDVELLPVYDDAGTKFYVINPCYCDSRILNRRKSKIKYNDDGGVFWVSDPVFYTRPSKPLFKIPEMSTKAYVDNSFVSVVKKHNLQGIDFVPCKIKEESVIDKILKSIHCLFLFSLIGALVASCAGSREEHQERKEHTDDTAAISDGFMSSSSSVELSEANKTSYEFVNSSSSKAIIEEIPSENSEKQVRKKNVKAANRIADVSALGEITISQEMPYFFDAFSQFVSSADFQTADIDNSLAGVFKQMLEEAYGGNANFYLEQKNAPQIDKELIEALMKEGRFEEAQNLRLKIVERYDSSSAWYAQNQDDLESRKIAQDFIYEVMLDIFQYYYASAVKHLKDGNVDEGTKQHNRAKEMYEKILNYHAEIKDDSLAAELKKSIAYLQNLIQEQDKNGSFTDSRDGQTYKTVRIGDQTWMAQNLNYKIGKNSCYNNNNKNCEKYGRLYDWNTAMKVCPEGWHLPSREEYEQLMITACGKESCWDNKLNSQTGWVYSGNNGDDKLGFSALPAGYYGGHYLFEGGQKFRSRGWGANFWTSSTSKEENHEAYVMDISGGNEHVSNSAYMSSFGKSSLVSVRCITTPNNNDPSRHGTTSTGYNNAESAHSYGIYHSEQEHLKK